MPYFICPRCSWRGSRTTRTAGFSRRPAGCSSCGFGFLFELLDDYYPSPRSGLLVCDQEARILAFGKGAEHLVDFSEIELMGQKVGDALDIQARYEGPDEQPHDFAIEWGVRVMAKPLTIATRDHGRRDVLGDFFPALDDDGGLLVSLTPDDGSSDEDANEA